MSSLLSQHGLMLRRRLFEIAWDPTSTAASITLSNSNRTATGNANAGGLSRSMTSKATGRWYAEVRNDAYSNAGTNGCGFVGLVVPGEPVTNYVGLGAGCSALWRVGSSLRRYLAGAETSLSLTASVGDVYMIAWDADDGLVWYGRNGSWMASGDPASGANPMQSHASLAGEHYLATGPRNLGNQNTLRATPGYAVPAGFAYWS